MTNGRGDFDTAAAKPADLAMRFSALARLVASVEAWTDSEAAAQDRGDGERRMSIAEQARQTGMNSADDDTLTRLEVSGDAADD